VKFSVHIMPSETYFASLRFNFLY